MKLKKYLTESNKPKILNELFIQYNELSSLPSKQKDIQMARLGMIAEIDASNFYEAMANQATNKDLKEILLDVAKEEKVHAGEFEFILEQLDPDWDQLEDDGEEEAEDKTK